MITSLLFYAGIGWLVALFINHTSTILPRRESLWQTPNYLGQPNSSRYSWSGLLFLTTTLGQLTELPVLTKQLIRSVIVEIATPLLFAFLFYRYGMSGQFFLITFYTIILIIVTITDLEHKLILNMVMLPAISAAALLAFMTPMTGFWTYAGQCRSIIPLFFRIYLIIPTEFWQIAYLGGAVGLIISYSALLLGTFVFGAGALGSGDVTLSTFLGLILGVPYLFLTLFMTVFLGAFVLFILLISQVIRRHSYVPYGPFLTVSGWLMLVFGNEIWQYYYC